MEEEIKNNDNSNGFTMSDKKIMHDLIIECGAKEYALYMILLSRRNTVTGQCFPSISLLAKDMGCTARPIHTMLGKLVDKNYLIINSGKTGINNNYYFPKESFYKNEANGVKRRKNVLSSELDKEIKKRNKNKNKSNT